MTGSDFNGKDDPRIHGIIKQILHELEAAIRQADSGAVAEALQKLDKLAAEQKKAIHPRLFHFLQNRSYDKARAFLEGDENIPAGICGGGR